MINQLSYTLKSNLKKAYKIGFFHLLSANLLTQIVGFGMQIFLSKIMAPDNLGRIKVLQSFIGIAIVISTLGLDVAIIKYCSEKIKENEKISMLSTTLKTVLFSSLIVLVMMFGLSFFKVYSKDLLINQYMRLYIIVIPILSLNSIFTCYLQSQKRVKNMAKIQSYSKLLNIGIVIGLVYLFSFNGYLIGIIIGAAISFSLFIFQLRGEIGQVFKYKVNKKYFDKLFYMGKYNLLTNSINQLIIASDALLINYLTNNQRELGYYSIAQLFILGLRMIPSTIQQIMIPYISEETNNIKNLIIIHKAYKKKVILLMSFICVFSYIFIPIIINIFFGDKYISSIKYFKTLIIGLFIFSLYAANVTLFIGTGNVKYNFYYGLFFESVNFILQYAFIKKFGIIGAAYGSNIAFLLSLIFNEIMTKRVLKANLRNYEKR